MSNPFIPLSHRRHRFDVSGKVVFVAMPCHTQMDPELMICLFRTMNAARDAGIELIWWEELGCSMITAARSKAAHHFLTFERKADFLFWIDSDIKWDPEDFVKLVAFASMVDVVGAAYPMKIPDRKQFAVNGLKGTKIETDQYGLTTAITGIGMGFSCVSRRVIEALVEKAPKLIFPDIGETPVPHIFREGASEDGQFMGEDMCFFKDAADAGFPLHVDLTVKLGHIGKYIFEGSLSSMLKKLGKDTLEDSAASSAA